MNEFEPLYEAVLDSLGYTKDELNCANARTALNQYFDDECNGRITKFIVNFIDDCTVDEFIELKNGSFILVQ